MTEQYLGQIKVDGEWQDYARGHREESADWAGRDPDDRRIVHWIYKERVLWENGDWTPQFGEFEVNIRIAHAAMQNSGDIARALRTIADTLDVDTLDDMTHSRTILDDNGQSVGHFRYHPDKD